MRLFRFYKTLNLVFGKPFSSPPSPDGMTRINLLRKVSTTPLHATYLTQLPWNWKTINSRNFITRCEQKLLFVAKCRRFEYRAFGFLGHNAGNILCGKSGSVLYFVINELNKFAAVCRKTATSCPRLFLTHDAIVNSKKSSTNSRLLTGIRACEAG